jgi:hypothetical protein
MSGTTFIQAVIEAEQFQPVQFAFYAQQRIHKVDIFVEDEV